MSDVKSELGIWFAPVPEATFAIKLTVCMADGSWDNYYIYTDADTPENIDLDYVRRWSMSPLGLPALQILPELIWFHSIVPADVAFVEEYGEIEDEEAELLRQAMLKDMYYEELHNQGCLPSEQDLINARDAEILSDTVNRYAAMMT